MSARNVYAELIRHSQQAALLGSCAELLGWDEDTYMPPAGVEHRGRQMALLAGLHHERLTDPVVGEWLAQVEGEGSQVFSADSAEGEAVNIRLWRRAHDRACRLPRNLVEETAQTASMAQQQWA